MLEMSNVMRQTHSLRTIEDTEVHWGAMINLRNDCYQCGLPLSTSKMNVTAFSCGELTRNTHSLAALVFLVLKLVQESTIMHGIINHAGTETRKICFHMLVMVKFFWSCLPLL